MHHQCRRPAGIAACRPSFRVYFTPSLCPSLFFYLPCSFLADVPQAFASRVRTLLPALLGVTGGAGPGGSVAAVAFLLPLLKQVRVTGAEHVPISVSSSHQDYLPPAASSVVFIIRWSDSGMSDMLQQFCAHSRRSRCMVPTEIKK